MCATMVRHSVLHDAGGGNDTSSPLSRGLSVWSLCGGYTNLKIQRLLPIAFCFILGGAIGNVIDRMMHGYVIDF